MTQEITDPPKMSPIERLREHQRRERDAMQAASERAKKLRDELAVEDARVDAAAEAIDNLEDAIALLEDGAGPVYEPHKAEPVLARARDPEGEPVYADAPAHAWAPNTEPAPIPAENAGLDPDDIAERDRPLDGADDPARFGR